MAVARGPISYLGLSCSIAGRKKTEPTDLGSNTVVALSVFLEVGGAKSKGEEGSQPRAR